MKFLLVFWLLLPNGEMVNHVEIYDSLETCKFSKEYIDRTWKSAVGEKLKLHVCAEVK